MKSFIALGTLLLLVACNNKTEDGFGKLTTDEQNWARQESYSKCISSSQEDFNEYKKQSAEFFRDRVKGDSYTYTLKKDSAVFETQKVTVWKNTGTVLYFVNTKTDYASNVTHQFIKYPLVTNESIIDDLQIKKCNTADEIDVDENQNSAIITKSETVVGGNYVYREAISKYSVDYPSPAYFYPFQVTGTIKEYDASRVQQGSTSTLTGTISGLNRVTPNMNYTDYNPSEFCIVKVSNAGPPIQYYHPLQLDCSAGAWPTYATDLP